VGLLLLSIAPGFLAQLSGMRWGRTGYWSYAGILAGLAACDVAILGPLPPFRLMPAVITAGAAFGVAYYWVEQLRLRRVPQGSLRYVRATHAAANGGLGAALALVAVAALEELLFRWFVLVTPVAAGWSEPVAVILSAVAFGLVHIHLGVGTAASRGLLGLVLAMAVLRSGDLGFAIFAHGAYNALVALYPRQYAVVQWQPPIRQST
jgi:membrane protease YdiL (CAAX protease family)